LYSGGNLRLWIALFTCVFIGLRHGEVMGLRWCDINLEKGLLRVEKNLSAPKSILTLGDTKTDGSRREILVPSSLKAALNRQQSAMEHEADLRGETLRPEMPVFATVYGGHGYPELCAAYLISPMHQQFKPNLMAHSRYPKKPNGDYPTLELRILSDF
jgi:integrase